MGINIPYICMVKQMPILIQSNECTSEAKWNEMKWRLLTFIIAMNSSIVRNLIRVFNDRRVELGFWLGFSFLFNIRVGMPTLDSAEEPRRWMGKQMIPNSILQPIWTSQSMGINHTWCLVVKPCCWWLSDVGWASPTLRTPLVREIERFRF